MDGAPAQNPGELIGSVVEIGDEPGCVRYLVLGLYHAQGDLMATLRAVPAAPDVPTVDRPVQMLRKVRLPIATMFDAVAVAVSRANDFPQSGIAWRAASARTDFKPYQFRPLLKFFGPAGERLLIADETGLGKTIEAGYILLERLAMGNTHRVLIVTPPRLREKWKAELRGRFGVTLHVIESYRSLLTKLESPDEPFMGIVSQDVARSGEVSSIHRLLGKRSNAIHLLIIDEVHELIGRGQETLRRQFATALSLMSESVIGMSATPVHLEIRDLGRVLQVIHPGLVLDETIDQEVEITAMVNQVAHSMNAGDDGQTGGGPSGHSLVRELERLISSVPTEEQTPLREFLREIQERKEGSPAELSARERALSATKLGSHLTRTRASEVGEERVRDIKTIRISLDSEPRILLKGGARVSTSESELFHHIDALLSASFSIVHRAQLSSSIPAIIDLLRKGIAGATSWEAIGEGESSDFALVDRKKRLDSRARDECRRLVDLAGLVASDSKWETLREELLRLRDEGGIRKALLFTHWIPTFEYLSRRLRSGGDFSWFGLSPRSGDEEIGATVRRFAEHSDFCILLVTDKMKEGFDLDAADCVINYDLPYNPQVMEQRIGRVDRVSQASTRIVVRNLVVTGSLDERIYNAVLERAGAFQRIVGTMRPISEEMVRKLESNTVTSTSAAETDVKVRRSLMNHDVFLGVEDALDPEIRAAHTENASWSSDLRWMSVAKLLDLLSTNARPEWDAAAQILRFAPLSDAEIGALKELVGRDGGRTVEWLLANSLLSDTHAALSFSPTQKGLPIVHPLVRAATGAAHRSFGQSRDSHYGIAVRAERGDMGLGDEISHVSLVRFTKRYGGRVASSVRVYLLKPGSKAVRLNASDAVSLLRTMARADTAAQDGVGHGRLAAVVERALSAELLEWSASQETESVTGSGFRKRAVRMVLEESIRVVQQTDESAESMATLARMQEMMADLSESMQGSYVSTGQSSSGATLYMDALLVVELF